MENGDLDEAIRLFGALVDELVERRAQDERASPWAKLLSVAATDARNILQLAERYRGEANERLRDLDKKAHSLEQERKEHAESVFSSLANLRGLEEALEEERQARDANVSALCAQVKKLAEALAAERTQANQQSDLQTQLEGERAALRRDREQLDKERAAFAAQDRRELSKVLGLLANVDTTTRDSQVSVKSLGNAVDHLREAVLNQLEAVGEATATNVVQQILRTETTVCTQESQVLAAVLRTEALIKFLRVKWGLKLEKVDELEALMSSLRVRAESVRGPTNPAARIVDLMTGVKEAVGKLSDATDIQPGTMDELNDFLAEKDPTTKEKEERVRELESRLQELRAPVERECHLDDCQSPGSVEDKRRSRSPQSPEGGPSFLLRGSRSRFSPTGSDGRKLTFFGRDDSSVPSSQAWDEVVKELARWLQGVGYSDESTVEPEETIGHLVPVFLDRDKRERLHDFLRDADPGKYCLTGICSRGHKDPELEPGECVCNVGSQASQTPCCVVHKHNPGSYGPMSFHLADTRGPSPPIPMSPEE